MSEAEFINYIGKIIFENWGIILSGFLSLIVGTSVLTWFIFNAIHKGETRLLKAQVANQNERFSQFESIMNQRLSASQNKDVSIEVN